MGTQLADTVDCAGPLLPLVSTAEQTLAQRALDALPYPVSYLDASLVFRLCNQALCQALERAADDIVGRRLQEVLPDKPAVWDAVARVLRTAEPYDEPSVVVRLADRPELGERVFEVHCRPDIDAEGRVRGVIASAVDLTDRTHACQEHERYAQVLRRSEEQFRRLAEVSPMGLVLATADGVLTYLNPTMRRTLGYSNRDLASGGLRLSTITPPEYEHNDAVALETLRQTGCFSGLEKEYVTREGIRVPVVVGGATVGRPEDGTSLIALFVTDLRPVREAERALQESEQLFRSTFESAAVGIAHVGLDGTWLQVNARVCEILGYSREELAQRTFQSVTHPDDLGADSELTRKVLAGEIDRYVLDKRYIRKDGRVVWVTLRASVKRNAEGRIEYGIAVIEDITARKEAEMARQQALLELERAKQEAELAAQVKSDFLASMSHEIRTPMNAILGFSELLLGTELTAEQRGYLELVKSSGDALLNIINDILDLSKLEAGKLELVEEPFDLRDVVEKAVRTVSLKANHKGLELTCRLPTGARQVWGDPGRLRQVLLNLLDNAIKFTDHGHVQLRVEDVSGPELLPDGQRRQRLRFSVTDTGPGIPNDKIPLLFQSFTQLRTLSGRRQPGTGLGLAISGRIVQRMGGVIEVQSGEGAGSTFSFTVGFRMVDAPAQEPAVAELRGLRALVVDDSAANRLILLEVLSSAGMEVSVASSAQEALAMLRAAAAGDRPVHVMLLDCRMPEMDGFDLVQRMRNQSSGSPAVIMLTSDDMSASTARSKPAGIARVLVKPVMQSELVEVLRAIVRRTPEQAATTSRPVQPLFDRPVRVLLAEDNLVNQLLIRTLLERMGVQVVVVGDGKAAIQALRGERFDAVLMDVQMPGVDGFEATKIIRRMEEGRDQGRVPIVALTAHVLPQFRERCTQAGMDGFLSKPTTGPELAEVLKRVLPQGASAPVLPGQAIDLERLAQALDHDQELMGQVLGVFVEDAPGRLAQVRQACEHGEVRELAAAAHGLRGSLLAVHANVAVKLAEKLEHQARDGRMTEPWSADIDELERQVRLVMDAARVQIERRQ